VLPLCTSASRICRPGPCAMRFFFLPPDSGRFDSKPVPSALTIQPAIWFVPLSFASRAGEAPLFSFPALEHRLKQLIQSEGFQASGSSAFSVSHRLCELFCIISRPVPRLVSSRKRLWASLYRGFPSDDGPRALTRFIPSCCYGKGGHLVCFRAL